MHLSFAILVLLLAASPAYALAQPMGRACHSTAATSEGIAIWGGAAACGVGVVPDASLWLWNGTQWLAHCVFDESTYRNRRRGEELLGRSILASRDAIGLIPREPLVYGSRYRVQVEADGRLIDWAFGIEAVSK